MKFTLEKNLLKAIIKQLGVAISANSVIPVLDYLLVDAAQDAITLTATNLELTISYALQIPTQGPAVKFCLHFRKLKEIAALIEDDLTISYETGKMIGLSTSNRSWQLATGCEASDFPKIPVVAGDTAISLDERFHQHLQNAAMHVSTDELRPAVAGICLEMQFTDLHLIATDAHTLFVSHLAIESAGATKQQLILPLKTAKALALYAESKLKYDKNNAHFNLGHVQVICRLIDAPYPLWQSVVPAFNTTIMLALGAFQHAIDSCMVTADPTTYAIDIFPMQTEGILLKSTDKENDTEAAITTAVSSSTVNQVRFNAKMLHRALDSLKSVNTDEGLEMSLEGALKPLLIRSSAKGDEATVLVMPMPIQD